MRNWSITWLLLVLAVLLEQGCWFRKEPRKATIVIPPVPQPVPPQPIANPPQLSPSAQTPNLKTSQQMPQLPAPVIPPKPKPKQNRKTPPVTAVAPPVTAPVSAPPTESSSQSDTPPAVVTPPPAPLAPALQPILATQEANERNRRIQQYLVKARVSVLKAERSKPDGPQKELIEQVRTFVQQAEDLRKVDLVRAENLAERAEVLARGLKQ